MGVAMLMIIHATCVGKKCDYPRGIGVEMWVIICAMCGKCVWLSQGVCVGKVCDYPRECVWERCVIIPGSVCGKGVWLSQGVCVGKVCDYPRECVWERCVIIPGNVCGEGAWLSQGMCGKGVWLSHGLCVEKMRLSRGMCVDKVYDYPREHRPILHVAYLPFYFLFFFFSFHNFTLDSTGEPFNVICYASFHDSTAFLTTLFLQQCLPFIQHLQNCNTYLSEMCNVFAS